MKSIALWWICPGCIYMWPLSAPKFLFLLDAAIIRVNGYPGWFIDFVGLAAAAWLSKCFLPSPASQSSHRVMGKQQTSQTRIDCMSVCLFPSLKLYRDSEKAECVVHNLVPRSLIFDCESRFMTPQQTHPTPPQATWPITIRFMSHFCSLLLNTLWYVLGSRINLKGNFEHLKKNLSSYCKYHT